MNGIALITGATAGIGRATALLLAENEYNVIITGRRSELLDKLELEIKSKSSSKVLSLCFDVRERKAVQSAVESIPENWKSIDILVNNAGLAAGFSPIQEGDIDDWEQMIDTNIKGLLYVTRAISPGMVERKTGHIINIGSIAGKEVYEKGNVYCGTKFAVDALSRGMRIDLVDHGIKVTAIHPGAVETEFAIVRFKGDKQKVDKVYEGMTPLYDKDIAEAILFAVSRPPHVNINDLLIMPTAQASSSKTIRNQESN